MATLAKLIEAPITGALGAEVNVGDTVMVVTTGYSHRVSVRKGVYKGYIESSGYGGVQRKARVEIQETMSKWFHKETGEEYSWLKHGYWKNDFRDTFEIKEIPYTRKSILQLNRIATISKSGEETVEKIGKLV